MVYKSYPEFVLIELIKKKEFVWIELCDKNILVPVCFKVENIRSGSKRPFTHVCYSNLSICFRFTVNESVLGKIDFSHNSLGAAFPLPKINFGYRIHTIFIFIF